MQTIYIYLKKQKKEAEFNIKYKNLDERHNLMRQR